MIVFRCYAMLGRPTVQIELHGECCGTGTCHQPDKREYEHADWTHGAALTTAETLIDLIHVYLSDMGDDRLSDALTDHLGERQTR
jgi:hypothetical protein